MNEELKRQIILDNYRQPFNKGVPNDNNHIKFNSRNVSCIDNLDIYLQMENDIIKDIKYEGEACVICISSTSILTNMLIGKTKKEALHIIDNYHKMLNEGEYDQGLLKELNAYNEIYKQPSRKTCANLSSKEIENKLKDIK